MNVLVTGGAGFIGANTCLHYARKGAKVTAFDNLSRTEENVPLLEDADIEVVVGDVSDFGALAPVMKDVDLVVHAAAQAAVTHSLEDPFLDFKTNALGTLNVVRLAEMQDHPPQLIYLSTNKVYGPLTDWTYGLSVSEERPLDPCTPYGCSKATGEIYANDWGRLRGVPVTSFRMSCIYGGHQYGDTHQGWVAHFMRSALAGRPITVYGNGNQVRDLLHIDDLLAAFDAAVPGLYNMGGGHSRAISVNQLLSWISKRVELPEVTYADWRPGDQRYYVTDTRKFEDATNWKPHVTLKDGLLRLWNWCHDKNG